MSAFRSFLCLNGSLRYSFQVTDTLTHGTNHSSSAQAQGNNGHFAVIGFLVMCHYYL